MAKFRVYEIAKKYNKDNKEILEIFKNFYLYSLKETDKDLPRLSQDKIKTLFHLYQQFDQKQVV